MGPLTLQLEIAYRVGTARGERSQLSALGVQKADFFAAFGDAINGLVLEHRERFETRLRAAHLAALAQNVGPPSQAQPAALEAFKLSRSKTDPKTRWVDQTPEYSFFIYPLLQLFPEARFIHMVRDFTAVIRSMVHFERTGGPALVGSATEACAYWLRTVRACWRAERALGSGVVRRFYHSNLVARSEQTLCSVLEYLGEPFEDSCLQPLSQKRINSSGVPAALDPADLLIDPALLAEAEQLNLAVMQTPPQAQPDPAVAEELQKAFAQHASDVAHLPAAHRAKAERIAELEAQLETHARS